MEIFHQQLIFFLALKWSNSSGNAKKFLHIGKKIFFVIYAFPKPSGSNTGILCLLTAPGNNNEVTTIERNIESCICQQARPYVVKGGTPLPMSWRHPLVKIWN